MNRGLIPFAHASNVFEVEEAFYKRYGIKFVFADLDNTLDPYTAAEPSERAKSLKAFYDTIGVTLLIISNNKGKRVSRYANKLGVGYRCWMMKPCAFRIKRLMKDESIDPSSVLLVGDQLLTDIASGNKAGVKTLLTEPVDPYDPPWTKVNRAFDRPRRKEILKSGLVRDWREML